MNRLDKPFKVGDKVIVNAYGSDHYSRLPLGATGKICDIPQQRWHNNEVTVLWDEPTDGYPKSTLGCWALDWQD